MDKIFTQHLNEVYKPLEVQLRVAEGVLNEIEG